MGHLLRKYPMPDPQRITYTFPVLASDNYIASAPSIRRFTGGWGWGNEKSKAKDFLRDKQGFNF
jgi:hypothetical protein